jgi:hypothetical protein
VPGHLAQRVEGREGALGQHASGRIDDVEAAMQVEQGPQRGGQPLGVASIERPAHVDTSVRHQRVDDGGRAEADGDVDADVAQRLPGGGHDLDVLADLAGRETLEAHLLSLSALAARRVDVAKDRAAIRDPHIGDGVEAGRHEARHRTREVRAQPQQLAVAVDEADGVGGAPHAVTLQQWHHDLAVAGALERRGQPPLQGPQRGGVLG